jgi:hypothetical protein
MRLVPLLVAAALLVAVGAAGARVVTGTNGDDRLVGTPKSDTLSGLGGRDVIVAGGGPDLVLAGAGRDSVDAGPGNDLVSLEYDAARDTARCGTGLDTVTADLSDSVHADCELVGRRLSRDPYTNPESQHESEVEPDSFTFGRTTVAVFQVGRRFDGAATNIGFAVTTDDGKTWRSGLLPGLTVASVPPGPHARASDPVVAYDAAHGTWLASTLALEAGTTRLAINRSADGWAWSDGLVAAEEGTTEGIAFDKNWIACDNGRSSPYFGRCYLAYTHSAGDDMLEVISSDDGGLTWSAPVDVGVRPAVGVFPVVRPSGELVLVYLWETRPFAISASSSADGGATFDAPTQIADVWRWGCGPRQLRAFPLPSADVDSSGRVWATWHDCPQSGAPGVVYVSTLTASTWSAPTALTSGPDALLPAIGVDSATGRVAVAYHRSRAGGIDVELIESAQGGTRFGPPRRLSARTMRLEWMPDTSSGRMLGDYISVHYAAARPLVTWVLASEPVGGELRQAVYATRG